MPTTLNSESQLETLSIGPVPRRERMPLWVPLLLCLPALIPLIAARHQATTHGLVPTTFIQYDQPAYVANSRQHFLDGFHWTYGNPYASYGTPRIYFQPHFFLLGMLQWAGLSPEAAWIIFGLATMILASLAAARLYEEWAGWNTPAQKIGFVCFFWGGGAFALFGLGFGLFAHSDLTAAVVSLDPGQGWWMLNFGRNLVYPQEAYYHGLFLIAILLLIRKRYGWTLAVAALLSLSHPFTGLSLALILIAYSGLELLLKSGAASISLLLGSCAIATAHIGYYMLFLERFADHRAVSQQFSQNWTYTFWNIVLALYLVGVLAFGRLTRWKNLVSVLQKPRMRLCLVWFAVILALTQHDLLLKPVQPIHFAHGYDWIALFLLATPVLLPMIEKFLALRPLWRVAAVGAFLTIFLFDNLSWLASFHDPSVQRFAVSLTLDEKETLSWLASHPERNAYVASPDQWISYLTPTYANMRTWHGHMINTPQTDEREQQLQAAFSKGPLLPANRPVYYIPPKQSNWTPPLGAQKLYDNSTYIIWRVDPVTRLK